MTIHRFHSREIGGGFDCRSDAGRVVTRTYSPMRARGPCQVSFPSGPGRCRFNMSHRMGREPRADGTFRADAFGSEVSPKLGVARRCQVWAFAPGPMCNLWDRGEVQTDHRSSLPPCLISLLNPSVQIC